MSLNIHSFVHSFVRSFVHSFIHSFVHSLMYTIMDMWLRTTHITKEDTSVILSWATLSDQQQEILYFLYPALISVSLGARCGSMVEHPLTVWHVIRSIHHGGLLSYFSFLPVLHNWCNIDHGMCYPVSGTLHINVPLLLIVKSSPCSGSSRFTLTIWVVLCHYITINKMCWVCR